MKFGTVLLTIFFAACALGGVVWVGYFQPISVKDKELREKYGINDPPEVKESGPQPKAETDETIHEFGQAVVGKEYHHVFPVTNSGDAPLKLSVDKTKSSCLCTIGSVGRNEVAPGETVEVKLSWTPEKPTQRFSHYAIVDTNDPNNPELRFEVIGEVHSSVLVIPPDSWPLPDILLNVPTKATGYVISPILEEFQIKEIKSSNPSLLSAKYTKLEKADLERHQVVSGYKVDYELASGVPIGPFNESLKIFTDAEDGITIIVSVLGHRYGPLKIQSLGKERWSAEKRVFLLGTVPSAKGQTSKYLLRIYGLGEKEFEFREMEISSDFLKFSLEPDSEYNAKGKRSKRYYLTLKIPAGKAS